MKLSTLCYIKRDDNKTLFLYRNKKINDVHCGKYIGLGGKFENGESPKECIIREVKEESGLDIKDPILKGVMTFPKFKDDEDWYVFLFIANKFDGSLIECDEGDLIWVDDDQIDKLNLWDGDRLFLKWMRENNMFSAKITYKNKELMDYDVDFY